MLMRYGFAILMRGKSPTCRKAALLAYRSMTAVGDRGKERPHRQVIDLPRIGVAEP